MPAVARRSVAAAPTTAPAAAAQAVPFPRLWLRRLQGRRLCKLFQTGQARWAGPGTTRKSPAQARPGPAACVPVLGTARTRARAWAATSAHGPARARPG